MLHATLCSRMVAESRRGEGICKCWPATSNPGLSASQIARLASTRGTRAGQATVHRPNRPAWAGIG